jgi:DNA modification methylase
MISIDVLKGDCGEILQAYPERKFDLIVTSPTYADRQKYTKCEIVSVRVWKHERLSGLSKTEDT